VTVTQFAPNVNGPFLFQAVLTGPTSDVSSTDTLFTITVPWNTFGQRYYIQITDQSGALVLAAPLIPSPPGYSFNLVGGYFSGSSLVFLEQSQQFIVSP
jgi:hypothetical protein